MSLGISFIISGLCISILINLVYFSKKRINSYETKLYGYLIIANFFGLLLEFGCSMASLNYHFPTLIKEILVKAYISYLVGWSILFLYYVIITSYQNYDKIRNILKRITTLVYVIMVLTLILLPVISVKNGTTVYATGPAVIATYSFTGVFVLAMLIIMLFNLKKLKNRKYLPLLAFVTLGTLVSILQAWHPELLMVTAMEAYVMLMMYFTIENPDLKLINELNIARDQANKANAAKSDFLSNMSHEIRTPLNAIVGFSQSLLEASLPDEVKNEVKDIIAASDSLLEIVNGVLDISKIEANKLEIINKEYNIYKMLENIVSLAKGRLGDKPLDFRTNFDQSIPALLFGDYIRIKEIIINLLTNSIKYTNEGFIEFKVSSVIKDDVCRLIISVEDSGIGIPKEKIDKLFTKFERIDLQKNISIEGTGLGLAITKKLVELMHGQIVVQSVYGQGSKFTVAIDQKIIAKEAPVTSQNNVDPQIIDCSGKRILVVDDNKINLKVIERLLRIYNLQVDLIASGQACIDKIDLGEKYDIIFMDDMMPNLSGVETLKKLKTKNDFNTPVVIVTANAISGMKENYLKEGFDDYLSKPIERVELNKVINNFLNKKKDL